MVAIMCWRVTGTFWTLSIFVAGAHPGGGKRFIVGADEKLPAFIQLGAAIRACGDWLQEAFAKEIELHGYRFEPQPGIDLI
jgi:hypothetical protein